MRKPVLTPRQRRLCLNVFKGMRQNVAAIEAGYKAKNSHIIASAELRKPHVADYLSSLVNREEFDTAVTVKRVLDELARIAFYDIGSFYKTTLRGGKVFHKLKALDELTPHQRAAISEYDAPTNHLKLMAKEVALDKLGKHLKLFTDLDTQQTNFVIMPVLKMNGSPMTFDVGRPAPIENPKAIK